MEYVERKVLSIPLLGSAEYNFILTCCIQRLFLSIPLLGSVKPLSRFITGTFVLAISQFPCWDQFQRTCDAISGRAYSSLNSLVGISENGKHVGRRVFVLEFGGSQFPCWDQMARLLRLILFGRRYTLNSLVGIRQLLEIAPSVEEMKELSIPLLGSDRNIQGLLGLEGIYETLNSLVGISEGGSTFLQVLQVCRLSIPLLGSVRLVSRFYGFLSRFGKPHLRRT